MELERGKRGMYNSSFLQRARWEGCDIKGTESMAQLFLKISEKLNHCINDKQNSKTKENW